MRRILLFLILLAVAGVAASYQKTKLSPQAAALIKEIGEAFKDVSRTGGVSWSESVVIDDYGSPRERATARAKDTEKNWEALVDDPKWNPDTGLGGWSFLDGIGFRYYLPAGMIRSVRSGYDEGIRFHLELSNDSLRDYQLKQWSKLNTKQRRCVRHFLLYMVKINKDNEFEKDQWLTAYMSYWNKIKL